MRYVFISIMVLLIFCYFLLNVWIFFFLKLIHKWKKYILGTIFVCIFGTFNYFLNFFLSSNIFFSWHLTSRRFSIDFLNVNKYVEIFDTSIFMAVNQRWFKCCKKSNDHRWSIRTIFDYIGDDCRITMRFRVMNWNIMRQFSFLISKTIHIVEHNLS